jgi:hypothetical protein
MHARVGFERSCSLSHKKASIRSNGKELSLLSESINEALYYSIYVYISFTELRLAAASDKVYQLHAHGRWFSQGTPASSTTTTGRHDIAEILLKVALKHQK